MTVIMTPDSGTIGSLFTPQVYAAGTPRFLTGRFTFPASYTTGGNSMDLRTFFNSLQGVLIAPRDGFAFQYDLAARTVMAFTNFHEFTPSVDPPSIAAGTATDVAVTVTGVVTADHITAIPPAAIEAGLVLLTARASGTNTVTLRLHNSTAGAIDGAARTWNILAYSARERQVPAGTNLSALTDIRFFAWGL